MSSDIIQMLNVVVWMQERFSSDQSSMTDIRPVFVGVSWRQQKRNRGC